MWLKAPNGRRFWRRKVKWHDSAWMTSKHLRQQQFAELISQEETKNKYDEKFFEGVEKRRDLLESREFKLQASQIPILLFLALILLGVDVRFSFLGLQPVRADNFREFLICLSSTLSFVVLMFGMQRELLNEILTVRSKHLAGSDSRAEPFFKIRYGLQGTPWDPNPKDASLIPHQGYVRAFFWSMGLLFVVSIGLLGLAILSLQIWAIADILSHPTFSRSASWVVVTYVVAVDTLLLLFHIWRVGPFLYKDLKNFNVYVGMEKTNPTRQQQILTGMIGQHERRSKLMRILGRPKLPKINSDPA